MFIFTIMKWITTVKKPFHMNCKDLYVNHVHVSKFWGDPLFEAAKKYINKKMVKS